MLDFSLTEILLVVVVAVIFIGPKELPVVLRAIARAMHSLKGLAGELKGAVDDLARESGMADVKKDLDREMRMITGDDGKKYEAYDINDFLPKEGEQPTPKISTPPEP